MLRKNYGCVRVDFNQPFSLKVADCTFHFNLIGAINVIYLIMMHFVIFSDNNNGTMNLLKLVTCAMANDSK